MDKITPKQARYIKLGVMGNWERTCLEDGTLRLGYFEIPHEMGLSGDKEAIKQLYIAKGVAPSTSATHASQVYDFYHCGADTLWFTFAHGLLWWCFAEPEVEFLGNMREKHLETGSRLRRCIGKWQSVSISGQPLRMAELNGALTKTAGYRQTICGVQPDVFDYLVRRINDEEIPVIKEARIARQSLLASGQNLIKRLPPKDFELFTDLIFSNSGWRRISAIGSVQKTIDIEMMLPSTGQRAFAQVKCGTNQKELDYYVAQLEERDEDLMFYVYHTSRYPLKCDSERVRLIGAEQLSEMALQAGLYDWLLQKAG